MTPLGPSEIRARRRPAVISSIALLRLGAGFCLALPLSSVLAASGVGLRAEGDRALFEAGGYLLLEVLRLEGPSLIAAARGLLPLLGVALALTALCNAALLFAINVAGRLAVTDWLSRSLQRWPGFLLLGAGTVLGQALLFGIGASVAAALPDPMARPVATSAGQLGIWFGVALAAGVLGAFSDLTKASLVRHETGLVSALRHAAQCLRRRPLATSFGWLPYAAAFVAAVVSVATLTEVIDVSRSGAWRVGLVFALHQLVVLLSVALRAAWFARALRLSAS